MVLWNFNLLWKIIVLCTKLWYYGENYGSIPRTTIYEEKNMIDYPKLRNFDL